MSASDEADVQAVEECVGMALGDGCGGEFFGVGVVRSNGEVCEFGGTGRRWASVEDFHADRAGREANLILYFPAEGKKRPV